jgi:hypothetical protein
MVTSPWSDSAKGWPGDGGLAATLSLPLEHTSLPEPSPQCRYGIVKLPMSPEDDPRFERRFAEGVRLIEICRVVSRSAL